MSMGNAFETALLTLLFNNTDIANLGDATGVQGSTVAGTLSVALHTGDPGEAGNQATNECAYGSYARVTVARSSGGWTVSGNQISNTAAVVWPEATSGSETATYFSIGYNSVIIVSAALTGSLAISTGITPQAAIGALVATAD